MLFNKEIFKNVSAVSIILISLLLIILWKNYEADVIEEAKTIIIDSALVKKRT